MKNIQIIDGAQNCVYDIFSATDEEFALIFPDRTDIAFIDEVYAREDERLLDAAFANIWNRRTKKLMRWAFTASSSMNLKKRRCITQQEEMKMHVIPVGSSCGSTPQIHLLREHMH